jgi:hypothetical protein
MGCSEVHKHQVAEILTYIRSRQALVHLTNAIIFYFEALFYVLLCLCIKFIGVV